jgi:hypothetical protein
MKSNGESTMKYYEVGSSTKHNENYCDTNLIMCKSINMFLVRSYKNEKNLQVTLVPPNPPGTLPVP